MMRSQSPSILPLFVPEVSAPQQVVGAFAGLPEAEMGAKLSSHRILLKIAQLPPASKVSIPLAVPHALCYMLKGG